MVKRLRHRPFTAVTRVRVSVGSPGKTALNGRFFVCSGGLAQLVRASALQAGGRWFKSDSLHHRSRKASFAALRRSLRSVCVCACVCSSARKVPFRSSARGLCVPPRVRSRSLAGTLLAGRLRRKRRCGKQNAKNYLKRLTLKVVCPGFSATKWKMTKSTEKIGKARRSSGEVPLGLPCSNSSQKLQWILLLSSKRTTLRIIVSMRIYNSC